MALNTGMIKRITNTTTGDVAHSSGYAYAQNSGNFGAAGGNKTSFEQRQSIDSNRQKIQSYGHSQVAGQHNFRERALTYDEIIALEKAQEEAMKQKGGGMTRQEMNSRLEAGGLSAQKTERIKGYGRTSAAEMRANRQSAASHRAAQAQRFAGGVKTFQGGPQRFSGGTGINHR